ANFSNCHPLKLQHQQTVSTRLLPLILNKTSPVVFSSHCALQRLLFLIWQRKAAVKMTFFNNALFPARSPSSASTGYVYPCLSEWQSAAQSIGLG
uniref:Uncharacterized protein n=1 Tax=Apteryx owenii TaxID=8824 RepID=A0A8B9PAD7_APTOW